MEFPLKDATTLGIVWVTVACGGDIVCCVVCIFVLLMYVWMPLV